MTDRPRVDLIGDRVTAISVSADLRAQLLEAGEQVAQLGSFEWLPGPDQLVWSDNLYRIYGLEVGEVVPTRALMSGQTHPDDRARVARFVEMTRATPDPPPLEYRIVLPSSAVRYLRSTITTIDSCDHAATRIVGAVQDITDHHLANREIAAHVAVSRVLAEWRGMEQSGPILLRDLAAAMEFACAVLWVPEGEELVCRVFWSSAAVRNMGDFETRTRALRPQRGMELPGQVWQNRSPINIADVHGDPVFPRCAAASRAGLRGAAGFAALAAGEVLAVLEFYYREEFRPTLRLIQTMSALGYELGEFFSRRRGDLRRQPLTARELQILKLASDGNSTPQIAERLSLSAATVKTHLDRTYRKLRASDRAAAVATALRWGLID